MSRSLRSTKRRLEQAAAALPEEQEPVVAGDATQDGNRRKRQKVPACVSSTAPPEAGAAGAAADFAPADADADGAAAASANGPDPPLFIPSLAQRCYSDALHCVFRFLDLSELLPAAHSCHAWLAAAMKEPPRHLTVSLTGTSSALAPLLTPALRKHVKTLVLGVLVPIGPKEFAQVAAALPKLECMTAVLDPKRVLKYADSKRRWAKFMDGPPFSPHLRSLTLHFPRGHSAASVGAMLSALPAATSLTSLTLTSDMRATLDLAPLLQLPALTELHTDLDVATVPKHLAVVKQLATLRVLDLQPGHFTHLWRDFAFPQLEELNLNQTTISAEIMSVIAEGAPNLVALWPLRVRQAAFPVLARMTRLRALRLCFVRDDHGTGPSDEAFGQLQSALRGMTELRQLTLGHWSNAPAVKLHLPLLLQNVPHLRSLRLEHMALCSLSCLAELPDLHTLALDACVHLLDASELLQASWVFKLRELTITRMALNADLIAQLTPRKSTCVLPALERFDFRQWR